MTGPQNFICYAFLLRKLPEGVLHTESNYEKGSAEQRAAPKGFSERWTEGTPVLAAWQIQISLVQRLEPRSMEDSEACLGTGNQTDRPPIDVYPIWKVFSAFNQKIRT